jgi:hypothetical protein
MRYQASFEANGVGYMMIGTKYVSKSAGPNVWAHTTTLFTTIARGGSDGYSSVAAGVIRLSIWQGARMLFTLRGTGSDSLSSTNERRFSFRKVFRRCCIRGVLSLASPGFLCSASSRSFAFLGQEFHGMLQATTHPIECFGQKGHLVVA